LAAQATVIAEELEAELEDYPDERGQILTEAAEYWHRAGQHDRAIALLTEAVTLGGEDGGTARVALADVLFDLGRGDEAHAHLHALRQQRPPSPGPYHLAAELLEDRGEYQHALTWINMAVSRLTDQEMSDRHHEFAALSYANHVLARRRSIRQTMSLPADELDESVRPPHAAPFHDEDDLLDDPAGPASPREVQVLFWPRTELAHAHQLWPGLIEHTDADTIIRDREHANRELSEAGIARISMVPLTTAKLTEFAARTGGDPTDEDTRRACMDEIIDEGGAISWPPPRNAPCWCGSTVKYKKCCGRPHHQ